MQNKTLYLIHTSFFFWFRSASLFVRYAPHYTNLIFFFFHYLFIEILSSWESLLHWSENASVARQLQDEMAALKGVLSKLGHRCGSFDSETSIQLSIEELKVSDLILLFFNCFYYYFLLKAQRLLNFILHRLFAKRKAFNKQKALLA